MKRLAIKMNDDIIPGVTWREWLKVAYKVRQMPAEFGISKIDPDHRRACRCGYCKRHAFWRPADYETADCLKVCLDGAVLWACRRHFNAPHKLEDL